MKHLIVLMIMFSLFAFSVAHGSDSSRLGRDAVEQISQSPGFGKNVLNSGVERSTRGEIARSTSRVKQSAVRTTENEIKTVVRDAIRKAFR